MCIRSLSLAVILTTLGFNQLLFAQVAKHHRHELTRLPAVSVPLNSHRIPEVQDGGSVGFQLVRGNEILTVDVNAFLESPLYFEALTSSPKLRGEHTALQGLKQERDQYEATLVGPQKANDKRLSELDKQIAERTWSFHSMLLEIGLNGAMIARKERAGTASYGVSGQKSNFVIIEAIGESPANNTGFAKTLVYANGQVGMTAVNSEYLLPMPSDSNDLFHDLVQVESRSPDGVMLMITDDPSQNPIARITTMPRFGAYFDTGFVEEGNFAQSVSLASRRDPRAGQTTFIQEGGNAVTQFDLLADAQVFDVAGQTVQFFVDANNEVNADILAVEQLGVRAYNRQSGSWMEGWALAVGKHNTVFGYTGIVPSAYDAGNTLIGTVDRRGMQIAQIAVHVPIGSQTEFNFAVEDPYDGDVFYSFPASGRANLKRWPTLASNFRWENKGTNDLFQIGGLVRSAGFESIASGQESFETLWGLSGLAKIGNERSAFVIGFAGGDGVGDYVRGVTHSAVATPTSISAVRGIGGFAGYQRLWIDDCGIKFAELNAAYGYSEMETPTIVGVDVDQKLHQTWINYTHFLSEYVGVGVEYQYGFRQVASGDVGEDHRLLFLIAIQSAKDKKPTGIRGDGFINGMIASDVVRQSQQGGAAFLQDF